LILVSTAGPLWANEISLSSNTDVSNEGYFVLSWQSSKSTEAPAQLLQSDSSDFSDALIKNVPAEGSVTLTGFDDGNYYFRLDHGETSSDVVIVEVAHHALSKALLFFFGGLVLFLVLGATIFIGHRSSRSDAS